jgi:hypothetical protein
MWIRRAALLPLLIFLSGCPQQSARTPPELSAASPDGEIAAPPRLTFSVREHLLDGGVEPIELQPNDRTPIEPTQQIELSTNIALHNYRIRILDEADRAVVSDDVAESTGQRLDYRISFHEPLKPGHRYTLVLDAETGSSFSDPDGAPQPDQRLEFQVTGEREKPPPPPPSKRRKSRRR